MSVSEALKKGLNSVKVSKRDATEFERKLEGEFLNKWHESCEVMKTTMVPIENIYGFLDHMKKSYEGFDDKKRQEVGAVIADQTWNETVVEWAIEQPDNRDFRYGILFFGRSPDKKYVDCIYVLFKMDFQIASKERLNETRGGRFCSKPQSSNFTSPGKMSWSNKSKDVQNYVRMKALEECRKEGFIENIKYVDTLQYHTEDLTEQAPEEIKDLPEISSEKVIEQTSNSVVGLSDHAPEDKPELLDSSSQ